MRTRLRDSEHDLRLARPIHTLNHRLHAIRILPFVRANAIVVVLLAMFAVFSASVSWDAIRSTTEPEATSLDRILAPTVVANPHVEVDGVVFPRSHVAYTLGANKSPLFVYVAMRHESSSRVLLVRFPGDLGHGEPRVLIVQGMLQPFDTQVARKLHADGWKVDGLPVERRYVLVAGARPFPLWLSASVATITTFFAIALLVAMVLSRTKTPTEPSLP